jgi:hypothetical protein
MLYFGYMTSVTKYIEGHLLVQLSEFGIAGPGGFLQPRAAVWGASKSLLILPRSLGKVRALALTGNGERFRVMMACPPHTELGTGEDQESRNC